MVTHENQKKLTSALLSRAHHWMLGTKQCCSTLEIQSFWTQLILWTSIILKGTAYIWGSGLAEQKLYELFCPHPMATPIDLGQDTSNRREQRSQEIKIFGAAAVNTMENESNEMVGNPCPWRLLTNSNNLAFVLAAFCTFLVLSRHWFKAYTHLQQPYKYIRLKV